jgi:hypothetical protein
VPRSWSFAGGSGPLAGAAGAVVFVIGITDTFGTSGRGTGCDAGVEIGTERGGIAELDCGTRFGGGAVVGGVADGSGAGGAGWVTIGAAGCVTIGGAECVTIGPAMTGTAHPACPSGQSAAHGVHCVRK